MSFLESQICAISIWKFASNGSLKADDKRKWMGHFEEICLVSKCVARMGQLFSSSRKTVQILPRDVEKIPNIDVINDGTKYIFSYGIRRMPVRFSEEMACRIGLVYTGPPSTFKIRYGG